MAVLRVKAAESAQEVMVNFLDEDDDLDAELAAIRASKKPKGRIRQRYLAAWRAVQLAEEAREATVADINTLRTSAQATEEVIAALEASIEQIQ